jgi:hypothetical protein
LDYGLNSPCEAPVLETGPATATTTATRRGVAGWLMLAATAALALFYVWPLHAALFPAVDEGYRRNFITKEFNAYPTSPVFMGKNGLGYTLGKTLVFDAEVPRLVLSRYDWLGWEDEGPYMAGLQGRVFLHMEDARAVLGRSLRLSLGILCNMPKGSRASLVVDVNGTKVGTVPCRREAVTAHIVVPAGLMGVKTYDQITLSRQPSGLWERVATRLGLRYDAVSLKQMTITARP